MKIMITSFGITDINTNGDKPGALYYEMPPMQSHVVKETIAPDYSCLLLAEKLIMDENSYEATISEKWFYFRTVAQTYKELYNHGFIELVNFRQILDRKKELLDRMLSHDMQILDSWVEPLQEAFDIWDHFVNYTSVALNSEARLMWGYEKPDIEKLAREALTSSKKRRRKEYRNALRVVLRKYLAYVNANIVLSNELSTGFHDWSDITPFYKVKFINVGQESIKPDVHIAEVRKFFELSFPEFAIHEPKTLLRILEDPRVSQLRNLITDAVEKGIEFDEKFARQTLGDVIKLEARAKCWRKVVSFLTIPLDFVPVVGTPLQKLSEEIVSNIVVSRVSKGYQWFYMLSEIEKSSIPPIPPCIRRQTGTY